ncbi:MAG: ATP-binding protein [bacterium]|nr:ATP-binding protein [bacterium]
MTTITTKKALLEDAEVVRRKLAHAAERLVVTAAKLAITAKEKEIVRRKLAVVAKGLARTAVRLAATAKRKEGEKEVIRRKLAFTAEKLAITAKDLAITAKEKEVIRRKLEVFARDLVATAKEKEEVRRNLAVTAKKLKSAYDTLEYKVFERTKSLQMARAKEEAILLSIGDGLVVTDEKGVVTIINETAEKLFGKKGGHTVGKVFDDVISLEDEKSVVVPREVRHMANGLSHYYVRKDGKRFPVSLMATPVVLNKKVIGTIKIFRDITYEREIDKAKTEFVSLASHQLRTPLSTVNWYAEMLLAGDAGELNPGQKKYMDDVYRSNQRMVELVNALLDVSSLELGTFVIDPQSVDVCELAKSVADEQMPQINIKKIIFSFSCAEDITFMQADPKLLRMVFQNMLSNAIKYTPTGGKIDVMLSWASKKKILVRIMDNGYGIPENQKDKIFTKFFRADNVRSKDTDGTGLGLYIVKSVVENSGGKIWFTSSEKEGESGTTFYVALPLDGMKSA